MWQTCDDGYFGYTAALKVGVYVENVETRVSSRMHETNSYDLQDQKALSKAVPGAEC